MPRWNRRPHGRRCRASPRHRHRRSAGKRAERGHWFAATSGLRACAWARCFMTVGAAPCSTAALESALSAAEFSGMFPLRPSTRSVLARSSMPSDARSMESRTTAALRRTQQTGVSRRRAERQRSAAATSAFRSPDRQPLRAVGVRTGAKRTIHAAPTAILGQPHHGKLAAACANR